MTRLTKGKEIYCLKHVKTSVRANATKFSTCVDGLIPGVYKFDAIKNGTWAGRVGSNVPAEERDAIRDQTITLHPKGKRAILSKFIIFRI